MAEPLQHAANVADAIAVGVGERARVHLVARAVPAPVEAAGGRHFTAPLDTPATT